MPCYDDQLQRLLQDIARKEQLEAAIRELNSRWMTLEQMAYELKNVLEEAQADVDRLEGHSLAAFFYGVVGKRDKRLTKEREQVYTAKIKLDAANRELEAVKQEVSQKEAAYRAIQNCEKDYEAIFHEKTEALRESGGEAAAELLELEKRIAFLKQKRKELQEAEQAGRAARANAEHIRDTLEAARNWAGWDTLGGGLVADLAKYDKLDEAQDAVETLQIQLQKFKMELADVTIDPQMQVDVSEFLRFADYFFDNIFTDLTVLNHISASLEQVERTCEQLTKVLEGVSAMDADYAGELEQVEHRLEQLVQETEVECRINLQLDFPTET